MLNEVKSNVKSTSLLSWSRRLIRSLVPLVFIVSTLPIATASAETMDWPVATVSESLAERDAAQRIALQLALTRISAYKGILNTETARLALGDVSQYVKEHTFRPIQQSDDLGRLSKTRAVTESGRVSSIAMVRFDAEKIFVLVTELEAALQDAQESAGEESRIVVDRSSLVWLVVRDRGRDRLITAQTGENLILRSKEIAGQAGETLRFPDASTSESTVADIVTSNPDQIRLASRTYKLEKIVTGLITRQNARQWQGQWQRLAAETAEQKTLQAASLDAMLADGIRWATGVVNDASVIASNDRLPPGPRSSGSESSSAEVWVAGAGSTGMYSRVLSWISQLEGVERVYPVDVASDGVLFSVSPNIATLEISVGVQSLGWMSASSANAGAPEGADLYLSVEP